MYSLTVASTFSEDNYRHSTYLLVIQFAHKKLNWSLLEPVQCKQWTLSIELLLFGSWVLSHYMEGVFAKRPTKSTGYSYNTHMHRLPRVILAQFFQTGSGHTRNTDPKCVYCCKRTVCCKLSSLIPLIQFTHTSSSLSRTAFFFSILFISALKALQRWTQWCCLKHRWP